MAKVKSVSFPESKEYLLDYIESTGRSFSSVVVEALEMFTQLEKDDRDFSSMKIQRLHTQIDSVNNQIKSLDITKGILTTQIDAEEQKYQRLKDERSHREATIAAFNKEVDKEMKAVYDEYSGVLPLEDCRPHAERRIRERRKT